MSVVRGTPRSVKVVYLISVMLHVTGGVALAAIHVAPKAEIVEVDIVVPDRPKPPKPPPPPEPEVVETARPAPTPKAAPPPVAAAAPVAAPDFGLVLGAADGPGGIAVAVAKASEPVRTQAKTLSATKPKVDATCAEEVVKAKASSMPRPAYTDEARVAAIEGKVRVQLTLDAEGKVTEASVLEGLGHGLDEAALEAVRGAVFVPATSCGKGVPSTFTVGVRFAL